MRFSLPPRSFDLSLTFRSPPREPERRAILSAARATLRAIPAGVLAKRLRGRGPFSLTVSVIGPAAMRKLNSVYRKKDRPTDVLSFSRLEGMPMPAPEVGDVLICAAVARKQAREYGVTALEEFQRLTVHGILHLFGYDHERDEAEARRMFRLQDKVLATLLSPRSDRASPRARKDKG